jgi:hypothetical protein
MKGQIMKVHVMSVRQYQINRRLRYTTGLSTPSRYRVTVVLAQHLVMAEIEESSRKNILSCVPEDGGPIPETLQYQATCRVVEASTDYGAQKTYR